PRGVRAAKERVRSHALLLRRVDLGEADCVVTLLTERQGVVSAFARSARRSTKRFAGLEPMHLLAVVIDERANADLGTLAEAAIVRPRLRLTGDLDRLNAAGRALRWVRAALPQRSPEPAVWHATNALLDALD